MRVRRKERTAALLAGAALLLVLTASPRPAAAYHSGDYNPADWSISLSELLRAIQFYNVGEYCCDPQGEDGYAPGAGDRTCAAHDADYDPADWAVDLSELLRLIQFYNLHAYHEDPMGEDGFAPGPSEIPPDPVDVAPPVDATVATTLRAATEFLYTGADPIQTGVSPGTIEARQAAVLRGRVLTRGGTPLPGARVTILGHPEFGQTVSREDGRFDLAVNGGGWLVVNYVREGFLGAQRRVDVPWNDFALVPDVVMVPVDDAVTDVDLTAPGMKVARGSEVTDEDGMRRATLLVAEGTVAEMVLPDGTRRPLPSMSVRATEFTVGEDGPLAMPAELPPTTAYTYCVEFTADEASAAGAVEVRFDRPLAFYLEDFVGFPVGSAVPTGYYDRVAGSWMASDNGRVVKLLSTEGAVAALDIDGDGVADDAVSLAELGITQTEREELAGLYAAGQSLWRVPVPHFTPWDCNWPYGPPEDAEPPNQPPPEPQKPSLDEDDDCDESGNSIIGCQGQVLGEIVPLVGTPLSLVYRSDRVPGRSDRTSLRIPLVGPQLPNGGLRRVDLQVDVAGRRFTQSLSPEPDLEYLFFWDGKDAYGRRLQSAQRTRVRIEYVYPAVYYPVWAAAERAFERVRGRAAAGTSVGFVPRRAAMEVGVYQVWETMLRPFTVPLAEFAGWGLDVHHRYDPTDQVLYTGDGAQKGAAGIAATRVVRRAAGTGERGFGGDGGPALLARFNTPYGVALGQDGSLYVADYENHRVRRVGPDGVVTTVAGTGVMGFEGDGGPATQARLNYPASVSVAPDGSLYVADSENRRIRRIDTSGTITTVAGQTDYDNFEDGIPATETLLTWIRGVAASPGGGFYIADSDAYRVRYVGPDGIIWTVAGNGTRGFSGDGGPATEAQLGTVERVALGPDGSIYIADSGNHRIRRVRPDGIIETFAGGGNPSEDIGDGGPATEAELYSPVGVTVAPDGTVYIAEPVRYRVRRVDPDGYITTVAGVGTRGTAEDNDPATRALLNRPVEAVVLPDGDLYVCELGNHRIVRVTPTLPRVSTDSVFIPSEDGGEIYQFAPSGRHLRTLDGWTGLASHTFAYDPDGNLAAVTDGEGGETSIERDPEGWPVAVVGPFGHRTDLELNADGYLVRVAGPGQREQRFEYTPDGLLTARTDAKGSRFTYEYDELGRLARYADPVGGGATLVREQASSSESLFHQVTRTTAGGRATVYQVETRRTGETRFTTVFPGGLRNEVSMGPDGSTFASYADGTTTERRLNPDPRWGMMAPLVQWDEVVTPGGLRHGVESQRTVTLQDPEDPLTLAALSETYSLNGQPFTRTFDAGANTLTEGTPEGRQLVLQLDDGGRVAEIRPAGIEPVRLGYDGHGRPVEIGQGSGADERIARAGYGLDGLLDTVTDPLGRTVGFAYDGDGRLATMTRADGEQVDLGYDANGNLTSVTPPGRPAHVFTHTPVDRRASLEPPAAPGATGPTLYEYNVDRQLQRVVRADGQVIEAVFDPGGRLSSVAGTLGGGGDPADVLLSYLYDPVTGRLASAEKSDGVALAFSWDGFLLSLESWSGTVSGSVATSYDRNFRVSERVVNGGSGVLFEHDGDGLLVRAGDLIVSRDPAAGRVVQSVLGQVSTRWTYNGFGEVETVSATFAGSPLFEASYLTDRLGRVVRKTEAVGAEAPTATTYAYDDVGRLVGIEATGSPAVAYSFDANGNRVGVTVGQETTAAAYDAQDRLLQYGDAAFTHNASGERTSRTVAGETTGYRHDAFGNLIRVDLADGRTVEYVTDAKERRVGKKIDGTLVQGFLYQDQLNPVAELDAAGQVAALFVYGSWGHVPDYVLKGGVAYRIIGDHLGSPRLVVNTVDGSVAQRLDYEAFGGVVADSNPGFQPFGFAGGLYDRDAELVHFGARDYDPATGRWTSKDPIDFSGGAANLYQYARNDPVNLLDPTGLWDVPWTEQECRDMYENMKEQANKKHCNDGYWRKDALDRARGRYESCLWAIDNWEKLDRPSDPEDPAWDAAREWARDVGRSRTLKRLLEDAGHTKSDQSLPDYMEDWIENLLDKQNNRLNQKNAASIM